MPTINQLANYSRKKKKNSNRLWALQKCPQKKGVCMTIFTRTPKKPNSALRKLARVRLSNSKVIFAYIIGEGHKLKEHAVVLVRGGRVPDVPGLKYKLIRGVYDFEPLLSRRQSRSKYGHKLLR
jgi:small subunit ribosomal protein S12